MPVVDNKSGKLMTIQEYWTGVLAKLKGRLLSGVTINKSNIHFRNRAWWF